MRSTPCFFGSFPVIITSSIIDKYGAVAQLTENSWSLQYASWIMALLDFLFLVNKCRPCT
jgi:hypothetical protein